MHISKIRIFIPILLLLIPAGSYCGSLSFLVPGVSLESVSFEAGARVTYLIISQAYGINDSSLVEIAVLDSTGGEVLLEITSAPYPALEEETVVIRLLLEEKVRALSSPGEFYDCIREVHIKEGKNPFREPSREEVEDFDLERLFLDSSGGTISEHPTQEETETPAGRFSCKVHEFYSSVVRSVKLGGVDAERREMQRSILWLSSEVPFWGLVRSRVEEESSTTVLSGTSPGGPRPKKTVTESILLAYCNRRD